MSIAHETAIKLMGIDTTIFGSILNPLVSSSKNLMRPPLDAGNGADFFLLLIIIRKHEFIHKNFILCLKFTLN